MKTTAHTLPTPDLGDDQIIGAVCGLRPCRHGGLRIETEQLGPKTVIHNYGHGGCGFTLSLGTAQLARQLVDQITTQSDHIAVLGAGVIGLSTAYELLKCGYRVSIYAHQITNETTSGVAGALWLPVGIDFGETPKQLARTIDALTRSKSAFESLDWARYGIEELPMYEPQTSATDPALFTNGTIAPPTPIDAFPFDTLASPGRVFTTMFIHTHRFLDALRDEVLSIGGEIHPHQFQSKDELLDLDQRVLINCMALGSRSLFHDKQVYAARGVLVHLRAQDLGYGVHDGFKYMFPRSDALILGGCFHEYDWDDEPDQEMVDEILTHHRRFFGQI